VGKRSSELSSWRKNRERKTATQKRRNKKHQELIKTGATRPRYDERRIALVTRRRARKISGDKEKQRTLKQQGGERNWARKKQYQDCQKNFPSRSRWVSALRMRMPPADTLQQEQLQTSTRKRGPKIDRKEGIFKENITSELDETGT